MPYALFRTRPVRFVRTDLVSEQGSCTVLLATERRGSYTQFLMAGDIHALRIPSACGRLLAGMHLGRCGRFEGSKAAITASEYLLKAPVD